MYISIERFRKCWLCYAVQGTFQPKNFDGSHHQCFPKLLYHANRHNFLAFLHYRI